MGTGADEAVEVVGLTEEESVVWLSGVDEGAEDSVVKVVLESLVDEATGVSVDEVDVKISSA